MKTDQAPTKVKRIDTILARMSALLARFIFWRQRGTEPAESTPAEDAALLAALNPPYRLYIRGESGHMRDIGVDQSPAREGGGEVNPVPVRTQEREPVLRTHALSLVFCDCHRSS